MVTSGNDQVARARLSVADLPVPGVLITANDIRKTKPHLRDTSLPQPVSRSGQPQDRVVFEDAPTVTAWFAPRGGLGRAALQPPQRGRAAGDRRLRSGQHCVGRRDEAFRNVVKVRRGRLYRRTET